MEATPQETKRGISRRKLIAAGGGAAAGAMGLAAVAGGADAAALPWNWAPSRSMAGKGTGVDPAYVWDPEADRVVEGIYAKGQVAQVNEALAGWRRNGQETPAGLPGEVRDFVEHARRLPAWADKDALAQAGMFQAQKGFYATLINTLGSGMLSTAIPLEARAVYWSAGGANMRDRVSKTFKMGADLGEPYAFKPHGGNMVSSVKTRLVHAAVRHLLPQSPHWSGAVPISNRDILVTWHTLPTYTMRTMRSWGVDVPQEQLDGYLHAWQVTAKLFGVHPEYIPANWDAAEAQSDQLLPAAMGPTQEGVELTDILLQLAAELLEPAGLIRPQVNAIANHMVDDNVKKWDQIPQEPIWDPAIAKLWPGLVALWDGASSTPLTSSLTFAIDEGLRQYVMAQEGRAQRIDISLPTGNRPE